jgi:hypothetical protein
MITLRIVGVTAGLAISGVASAYVLLSPERSWPSPPTYIVDSGGLSSVGDSDGGVAATINAITSSSAWNGGGAGTVIYATSGSTSGLSLGDGVPMLDFGDPIGACSGSCLAATFTGYYTGSDIYDADIVTNLGYNWTSTAESGGCSSEFYVEGVMVHEIGHGLGIAHSSVGGATMYPSVSACNNGPATTEADDDAAIVDLYGGGGGGADPDSCLDNATCGGQAPGGCWCDAWCAWYGDCCSDGPC